MHKVAGPIFNAAFSAAALTTAGPSDLFHITAPANSRVAISEIRLGQYSEFGDAQSELLSLTLLIGTTSAAVGSTITPRNVLRHTGAPTAGTAVSAPSTTLSSTASATLIIADAMNVAAGYWLSPAEGDRIVLNPGQRAVLRMSTPNDPITMNGTLSFQEIGVNRL